MATKYPLQIDNLITLPSAVDGITPVTGLSVNRIRDAVFAIESALGTNPAAVYGTVSNRLTILEQTFMGISGGGNVVSSGAATLGQTLIWNGSTWTPSTDFVNQNLKTSGGIMSGPALSTTATTGLNQLTGKLIFNAISPLQNSDPGQGILYFDGYQFLMSQNSSPYVPLNPIDTMMGGDLVGIYPNPLVNSLRGVNVPASAPVAGNIMQASGPGVLIYGPVDLSSVNVNHITGVLPASKQADQILGGDLSGTTASASVIALRGTSVSATAPVTDQILQFNGSVWAPAVLITTLSGDVTGPDTATVVQKINGATVPVSGSLVTGNVLQVTGASALGYAPVNMAGGSNFITGVLPTGNQAPQSLVGDVSGTTASNTVNKIQGFTFDPTTPVAGQFVVATSTSTYGARQITGDVVWDGVTLGSSTIGTTVVHLRGTPVGPAAPSSGQLFGYNGIQWQPVSTGGDVSGGYNVLSVDKIKGTPVSATAPTTGQILTYSGSAWAPAVAPAASGPAGGDLSGTYPNPTVAKIQGNTFTPGAPPLKGMFVMSTSTSNYGPVQLSGDVSESNTVAGQLTVTMAGDVTGTAGSSTVAKVNGITVTGTPTSGASLVATSSTAANWQIVSGSFSPGGDLAGSPTTQRVIGIQSIPVSSTAPTSGQVLQYNGTNYIPTTLSSSGSAGGDLSGTYPNPTVAKIQGNTVTSGALTKGQFFVASSTSNWAATTLSGDISESGATAGLLTVTGLRGISVPSPTGTNTVLTFNAGAYTWSSSGGSGISQLTGDVLAGPGSGSQAATVVALRGNPVASQSLGISQDGYVLTWDNTDGYWKAEPSSGSGTFVPTGTGIPHIVGGVQQPAASLIVNADVSNSAGIVYSKLTLTNSIVDADVSSTAAIAGTKVVPSFGSQNISTSGTVTGGGALFTSIRDSSLSTGIVHSDSSGNFSSSAVNLASADVTGVLPAGNQASQTLFGDLSGTTAAAVVTGLQTYPVKHTTLTGLQDGYVLTWNFTDGYWEPIQSQSGPPSGPAGGDLGNFYPNPTVEAIQGNMIQPGTPPDGYVLTFNALANQWQAEAITSGSVTLGGDVTGPVNANTLSSIQGIPVVASFPNVNQVLGFDGLEWTPTNLPTTLPPSGAAGGNLAGTYPNPTVVEIYNAPVSNQLSTLGASEDGYVMTWDNGSTQLTMKPTSSITPDLFGDVVGPITANTLMEIQGNQIYMGGLLGAMQDGYVLTWDNTAGELVMKQAATSAALDGDVTGTPTDNTVGQRKAFLFMGA